jgi:glutamyl-tRNA reductase
MDIEQALEVLAKGLSQKMLHGSFAELRNADLQAQNTTAQSIQRLFLRKER